MPSLRQRLPRELPSCRSEAHRGQQHHTPRFLKCCQRATPPTHYFKRFNPPDNPIQALRWCLRLCRTLLLADPELLDASMRPKQLLQLFLDTDKIGDEQLGGSIVRHLEPAELPNIHSRSIAKHCARVMPRKPLTSPLFMRQLKAIRCMRACRGCA